MKNRYYYQRLFTADLINLIVNHSDTLALNELQTNRKPFTGETKRINLPEFLHYLQGKMLSGNDILMDCAHDLTVDKFTSLPAQLHGHKNSSSPSKSKPRATDCRNYYRAIMDQFDKWKKANPKAGKIDEELAMGVIFQRMVVKHFYLSIKECRRAQMPFMRRYLWKVKKGSIYLKCPIEVSGREFRKWLEENIPDPDPKRPNETETIQSRVHAYFSQGHFVAWDEKYVSDETAVEHPKVLSNDQSESSRLGETVAREKAANIDELRPAIRKLGPEMLSSLILRIFKDLEDGVYEDNRIATAFGLSKATFSRFAGSDWSKKIDKKAVSIPDLWLNTANILASDSAFMEIALSAGVLPKLQRILKMGRTKHV
jgi:hypothetical protein